MIRLITPPSSARSRICVWEGGGEGSGRQGQERRARHHRRLEAAAASRLGSTRLGRTCLKSSSSIARLTSGKSAFGSLSSSVGGRSLLGQKTTASSPIFIDPSASSTPARARKGDGARRRWTRRQNRPTRRRSGTSRRSPRILVHPAVAPPRPPPPFSPRVPPAPLRSPLSGDPVHPASHLPAKSQSRAGPRSTPWSRTGGWTRKTLPKSSGHTHGRGSEPAESNESVGRGRASNTRRSRCRIRTTRRAALLPHPPPPPLRFPLSSLVRTSNGARGDSHESTGLVMRL